MKADGYPDIDPWVVDWFEFVMVGGCDWLRDEGLAYAERLREAGVPTEELTSKGQPHGFLNLDFPAAAEVYDAAGRWLREVLAASG